MQIEYSKQFIKCFKKCPESIKNKFKERLKIFLLNKNNHILNNHQLQGKLNSFRSINISGDYRAIFQEIKEGEIVYFITIGSHSELYK